MMRYVTFCATLALLSACGETTDALETGIPQIQTPASVTRPNDTTFEDVLAEYQALNLRLDRVAASLRISNTSLCPNLIRDPGFSIHRLEDYPQSVQSMAKVMLGIKEGGLFIRSVRPNTSAAEQKLTPGDEIMAVNEHEISPDKVMTVYNRAVLQNGFESVLSKVRIQTPEGQEYLARIKPTTACDVQAKVIFSETVNGHTDGEDVLITSALMNAVPDDTNLALVIAHEMGHVIAGHAKMPQSQTLELEADRMALVLMARAGYDVNEAVAYWERAAHPHEGGDSNNSSHPTTRARYENFQAELKRIKKSKSLKTLEFK